MRLRGLNELFEALPDGKLRRRVSVANNAKAGSIAGSASSKGYTVVVVNKVHMLAHRIIWEMHHGEIPDGHEIDHINGVRDDNRIANLRLVKRKLNMMNKSLGKNSKFGILGVYWRSDKARWQARIKSDGVDRHLGYYNDFVSACEARIVAGVSLGFHCGHGKRLANRA